MKEIIKILKNYKFVKKDFFTFLFFGILYETFTLFYPKITQYLIQVIENKGSLNDLYYWVILLSVYTIILLFFRIFNNYFWIKVWLNLFSKKQLIYQENIIDKNYKDVANIWTWKLVARLESWTQWEVDIFTSIINILIEAVFKWIIILIILAFHIPKIIFIVIWWIFILTISNYFLRKYISKYTKQEQEFWEEFWRNKTRVVMENLTIKLFWKKNIELEKSKKVLNWWRDCWIKVDTANELYYKLLEWTIRFIEIWVFIILGTIIIKEWTYNISYLVMIIWYIWFLRDPIDKAISNLNRINKMFEKYKKLQEFIEQPNQIKNWEEKYIYKTWKIEFRNVDFGYSEKNKIFKKLNLNFLEWKKNALVGHSWWWKSTIVKILLRLYDYENGEILVDNQELKKLKIESFYEKIWYLPQEPWIFDWTIKENMEYAFESPPLTPPLSGEGNKEKLIWEALEKAQIDNMVKKLEKWLDTEVGEKWIKLSWGEKQRLAIARIFLKNPKIIILDEPTSALDSISESEITKALDELMKNRTAIVIAHRLQTVMYSDKIIVLENGEIESEWTHLELMGKSETYKTLVDLQNGKIME